MGARSSSAYREYLPPPDLRPYVACYWERASRPSGVARVLPDGCVDFLFDRVEPGGRLIGAMTRPITVKENGRSRWLGVRFRPGGAFPFLPLRLAEATDTSCELGELWPEAEAWAEKLAAAPTARARTTLVSHGLARRLGQLSSPVPSPLVSGAAQLIERRSGVLRVSDLADELGTSRQHLNRLFEAQVGLSVKRFARIARMQAAVRLLRSDGAAAGAGAEAAVATGFFDQSHFISDFKSLTGSTPGEFARDEASAS